MAGEWKQTACNFCGVRCGFEMLVEDNKVVEMRPSRHGHGDDYPEPYCCRKGFGSIGAPEYPGTKLFSLSGDVRNKGVVEFPTDATLRDLVEGFGGGVREGHKIKAIQMGGGSCGFITEKDLDTPLDFESMRAIGASLGSGAVLVLDETHNMAEFVKGTAHFFAHESCGKCSPCREGTSRLEEIMDDILTGGDFAKDKVLIEKLNDVMSMSCFCPLGQGACTPVMSALKLFPEDFKARKEA